jgi:magnesium transporter
MTTALLFDRHAVEEIEDWTEQVPRLGRSSVLWIDLEGPSESDIADVADRLDLGDETRRRLVDSDETPQLGDFENYVHVTACAPEEDGGLVRIDCLVSKRWVVTVHEEPLEVLERFREHARGPGDTGRLDGLELLADLLEWVLESYFDAFEDIELVLEDIDTTSMAPGDVDSKDEVLGRLVDVRREIGRLRRALTSHREMLLALTRPELHAIASSESAERFSSLRARLDEAVQAARDSRESVVGSFDVLIASTGQRTNDIMKVLTLVSVLILPGTLLAGIMGMNFKLGLFGNELYFWIVLAAMVVIAIATLGIARIRHWI